MRFFAVVLIFYGATASYAQAPEVPHKMRFADMTLTIRDDARREIQKDVDALTRHPKYYDIKVERARTYFPLISKIFAEENVPDDLKYLVLQESSLVADAVSVSNAVGFWQFKDFTAISMGLRVDKQIDERMNIASASRGAAGYLKQNNQQFDNWIIALQAYQMGAGGVKRLLGDKHNGKRHFEVNSDTYWYIKKFIAHKIAFENAVLGEPQIRATIIQSRNKQSLSDLSRELRVEEDVLKQYNKWVLKGEIPDDKSYIVIIPNGNAELNNSSLVLSSTKASKAKAIKSNDISFAHEIKFINGLRAIKALEGESLISLANRSDISIARFLKFNEMQIDHSIEAGSFYFLEKKKKRSMELRHQVKLGDDLWSISQSYGLQLKKLQKWNYLIGNQKLPVGSFVWLSSNQPQVGQYAKLPEVPEEAIAVLEVESFNWEVKPSEEAVPNRDTIVVVNSPTHFVAGNDTTFEHFVSKGETLYSISKIHQVAVMDLAAWNNLSIRVGLMVGQKIQVNNSKAGQKVHSKPPTELTKLENEQLFHSVKESDTLYAIARQYGVTIKDLMDWNDKKELTVKEGEKILILKK